MRALKNGLLRCLALLGQSHAPGQSCPCGCDAEFAHPDGGSGGLCRRCHAAEYAADVPLQSGVRHARGAKKSFDLARGLR